MRGDCQFGCEGSDPHPVHHGRYVICPDCGGMWRRDGTAHLIPYSLLVRGGMQRVRNEVQQSPSAQADMF